MRRAGRAFRAVRECAIRHGASRGTREDERDTREEALTRVATLAHRIRQIDIHKETQGKKENTNEKGSRQTRQVE